MGQLLFKKVFWAAVRDGTKRTTIRRWATPRVKPGQRAWSPGVGWLVVDAIERVERLDQLSDADAVADGFASAVEMRLALRSIYPQAGRDGKGNGAGDGRAWFRVAFHPEAPDGNSMTTTTTVMTVTKSSRSLSRASSRSRSRRKRSLSPP